MPREAPTMHQVGMLGRRDALAHGCGYGFGMTQSRRNWNSKRTNAAHEKRVRRRVEIQRTQYLGCLMNRSLKYCVQQVNNTCNKGSCYHQSKTRSWKEPLRRKPWLAEVHGWGVEFINETAFAGIHGATGRVSVMTCLDCEHITRQSEWSV